MLLDPKWDQPKLKPLVDPSLQCTPLIVILACTVENKYGGLMRLIHLPPPLDMQIEVAEGA